jgi:hypothetical protein
MRETDRHEPGAVRGGSTDIGQGDTTRNLDIVVALAGKTRPPGYP